MRSRRGSPYGLMLLFWLFGMVLTGGIDPAKPAEAKDAATPDDLFAGVRFIRNNPAILGTISLDLFAVLFGGVTALLPIYARDILRPARWASAFCARRPRSARCFMTACAWRATPSQRRVGMRMFQAVIVFGVATIVFALSQLDVALGAGAGGAGRCRYVSVVIRFSLVQLATPNEMRGRVGAVNFLFINASNQLGQFESGVTAALFGTVPAAVLGGVATVAVALSVDEAVSDAARRRAAGVGALLEH